MSYKGLVQPILAARGGEFVTGNINSVSPIFLRRARNLRLDNDLWETELGTRLLNASAVSGSPVVGTLHQYMPVEGVERLILCGRDGTIWKSEDGGGSYTQLTSGLLVNRLMVPVECGAESTGRAKRLVLLGAGPPQVLTGDATTAAALSVPSVATYTVEAVAGGITAGLHRYAVTFVTAQGETAPSALTLVLIENTSRARVAITSIPPGPAGTVSRRIYRSKADDTELYLLTTLADNLTTEATDTTPDGSLGSTRAPVYDSTAPVHRLARPHDDWATGGDQPSAGFLLEGRLAVMVGHFLYVSARGDHEDFLSAPLSFPIFTGKGDRLVGGVYWRQQGWVFKRPRGLYRVDTSNLDTGQWQVHEHTEAVGLAGPLALTVVKGSDENEFFDDVIFIDPQGSWHRLSKTSAYQEGDVNAASISESTYGKFIRDTVDKTRLPFAQLIYNSSLEEVQAAVTQQGSSTNDLRIKANLKRMKEYGIRFHHSTFPSCEALALKQDNDGVIRPVAGTSDGFVKQLDQEIYSDAGGAYQSEFWTYNDDFRDLNPRLALLKKNYHFLVIEGVAVGDWTMVIEVYLDGIIQARTLAPSLRGKDPDVLVLDKYDVPQRLDRAHLDPNRPLRVTLRLRGCGHRIAFRGYLNTAGRYFRISRLLVLFSAGGFEGEGT